jgi:hypothetical protein
MLDELTIRARKLLQATSQRVSPRLEQSGPLDGVVRKQVDNGIAQLCTVSLMLAAEPVHLIVGNYADPFDEVGAQFKCLVFSPEDYANFLKYLLRMGRVPEERNQV